MDTSSRPSIGRGRGRARNLANALNPGANGKYAPLNVKKDEEQRVESLKLAVDESLRVCLAKTTPENIKFCLSKTEEYAKSETFIQNVIGSLFEMCLKQRNFAANGGQVATAMISSEAMPTFRTMFFKKFQEMYANREMQRKNDFEKYICFSTFLCSIFNYVRVSNGQVIKVLTKPVYDMLYELLNNQEASQREKAIEVFRDNLLMVAPLLQETDKNQMDELFNKVRRGIVRESSPTITCTLLELLEHYSAENWSIKPETKNFYKDLINHINTKS